jgi:hypothetical protein
VTRTAQVAQTIANLAGTATGFADGAVRYAAVIKADSPPDEIRDLLTRFFEAEAQLHDLAEAMRRLAPNAAKAGEERAATMREGLKL